MVVPVWIFRLVSQNSHLTPTADSVECAPLESGSGNGLAVAGSGWSSRSRITSVTAPKRVDKLRRFSRIRLPRRALARPLDPWIDGRDSKRDAPRFRLRLEEKRSCSLTIDQVIHVGACR